ncbi:heterokaryon incompatibility (het-6OR allele) [Apiospora hydei]|uniref:Heterokaryon incompatibility (Het-6OR allele) n=1 Tax=Apiospora hydei TaxID=1337664 RepID=A0ABR1V633_9PEZI
MERFKGISPHRPLGDSPTEIRIVNLLPGEYGDPIECELEHIDIDITKDYDALSYCWGEASITKPIRLDSMSYPVTTNLFDGLQRLRKSDGPQRLWIDSLCINQSDLVERSHEIQKMSMIYKHASQVLIWLGDYLPWSEAAVQSVADYVADITAIRKKNQHVEALVARYGYTELWHKQKIFNEFLRQRQWFERCWVLQEVAVRWPRWAHASDKRPEILPIFWCGSIQISYFSLRLALMFWKVMPTEYGSLKFLGIYRPAEQHLEICFGYDQQLRKGTVTMTQQLIGFLMAGAAHFKATDPRDRIYAVLGLLIGGTLPAHLLHDYRKSTRQVLVEFGKYLLEERMTMDGIQYRSGTNPDLPSWVPDWKHNPAHTMILAQEASTRNFIKGEGDEWYLQADFLQFDVLKEDGLNATSDARPDDPVEFVEEFLRSASAWLCEGTQKHRYTSAEDAKVLIKELILKYDYTMNGTNGPSWHQLILDSSMFLPVGEVPTRIETSSEDSFLVWI